MINPKIDVQELVEAGVKLNEPIKNMNFIFMDHHFRMQGWYMVLNLENHFAYAREPGHDNEHYEIEITSDRTYVSVPLRKIPYQYKLNFATYQEAFSYVETQFENFMNRQ
jgi:hypothetical protein